MLSNILSLLLSITLIALGLIHFNWALGGKWGFEAALPTNEAGKRVLNPKKFDSLIVGLGLSAFGAFYLFQAVFTAIEMPNGLTTYGGWIIPSIFLPRAIGDFRFVGFFKKIKSTPFAKMDTKLFSPLCLCMALAGFAIQLLAE
ncbi:uncharacterized protein DUF3995 [Roseivirga ehrenbergii]|uniref:DUF3995 domain-containing protein n=1 Tax=Roseivirga ehrenbergii (strain DSM 102268 / JCM 13514 / KCTC 12282 / NCIMB 14502 / KMM 6017) TaxID=279360 RepID=A0A150X0F0_ROSEK|nr:DUF3995 domain-containing protein [Roseivirga ehrenbergii]KYG72210.1 hypothetical protein MB14_09220 [Roseivirga ehrenbergii]TCL13448.1 uncharacterized protein DUF3995 [Roseivirga ehrenbergii]